MTFKAFWKVRDLSLSYKLIMTWSGFVSPGVCLIKVLSMTFYPFCMQPHLSLKVLWVMGLWHWQLVYQSALPTYKHIYNYAPPQYYNCTGKYHCKCPFTCLYSSLLHVSVIRPCWLVPDIWFNFPSHCMKNLGRLSATVIWHLGYSTQYTFNRNSGLR